MTLSLLFPACAQPVAQPTLPRPDYDVALDLAKEHHSRAPAYVNGRPGYELAQALAAHIVDCKLEKFVAQAKANPWRNGQQSERVVGDSQRPLYILALGKGGEVIALATESLTSETDCVARKLEHERFPPPPFSPLYIGFPAGPPP